MFAQSLTRFAFRNPNVITYGYATFGLLLQNSSITKQKSIGSFIVTLMNSPITKQKGIGSFIVTLMNSPITKRCFVIFRAKPSTTRLNECEESLISRYF